MIKNDFYPTAGTSNYDFDITAVFMSLPDEFKTDMGRQYLMGYCDVEHMPACCTPVYFNHTADELSFLADNSQNYGFGFARWTYDGGAAPGNLYYIDGDNNIVRSWGVNYDFAFINRGEMCRVNANNTVEIFVEALFIQDDFYDGDKCTRLLNGGLEAGSINNLGGVWLSFTFTDFVNMIVNDAPIVNGAYTGTGGAAGVTFNITVRPSDFGDSSDPYARHYVTWDAGNGYYVYFCIEGIRMSGNTPVYYNETSYPANIVPFFMIPHTTDKKSIIVPGSYIQSCIRFRYENGAFTGILQGAAYGYNQATDFVNNAIYGGFNNGTLSVNAVNFSDATLSQPRRNVFFINNFYGVFLGAGLFRLYPLYTPRDIYNYLCLYHKHTATPSDNYSAADTVTVFDATDAPTFETVSGTLSEIAARLRPWQFPNVDISVNDFTPDDIPIPEPEDADSTGDDIRDTDFNVSVIGAGNNFVTLYAMSSDGVSDMGKQLWASLSDPTYWQTVGTVFTNDFSINPADMLKYFLSLRYFPFNLSNLPHSTASGIYIGRASAPLAPSTGIPYPLRMQKSICQLDGGSLTIRRKYNDFRDFEPCTTVQIHVPFCGTVDVPASEVVGKTLYLSYKIDLQTGAMLGVIAVQSNTYYVIATVAGSCGASIPITANNNIEFLQRIATVAGSGISGGISGGIKGASVGGEVGAVAGAIVGGVGGGVGALAGLPPVTVHKQGNASGFANLGGVPCAYVTIQRQRYSIPENYGHTSGYACDVSETVGNLSGFAVCENVDTSGLSCNATERAEIKRLLESGIYI